MPVRPAQLGAASLLLLLLAMELRVLALVLALLQKLLVVWREELLGGRVAVERRGWRRDWRMQLDWPTSSALLASAVRRVEQGSEQLALGLGMEWGLVASQAALPPLSPPLLEPAGRARSRQVARTRRSLWYLVSPQRHWSD